MRYSCTFLNPETDERKTVIAVLTPAEIKSLGQLSEHAELHAHAYALRHAYVDAGAGFLHVGPPTAIANH